MHTRNLHGAPVASFKLGGSQEERTQTHVCTAAANSTRTNIADHQAALTAYVLENGATAVSIALGGTRGLPRLHHAPRCRRHLSLCTRAKEFQCPSCGKYVHVPVSAHAQLRVVKPSWQFPWYMLWQATCTPSWPRHIAEGQWARCQKPGGAVILGYICCFRSLLARDRSF